jgi:hypothetical protein
LALQVRRLLTSDFSSRKEIADAIRKLPGFGAYLIERVRGQAMPGGSAEHQEFEDLGLPQGSPEWVLWRFGARVVESCLFDYLRGRPWAVRGSGNKP